MEDNYLYRIYIIQDFNTYCLHYYCYRSSFIVYYPLPYVRNRILLCSKNRQLVYKAEKDDWTMNFVNIVRIILYSTSLYIVQIKAESYCIVDNKCFVFTFIYVPSTHILANHIHVFANEFPQWIYKLHCIY